MKGIIRQMNDEKDGGKRPYSGWVREADQLEQDKENDRAILEYEKMRKAYPLKEHPYDRLMILYRKTGKYREEDKLIAQAIHIFKDRFQKQGKPAKSKVASLSKAILRSTGLTDRKGNPRYQEQPVGRWQKRKALLQAKLK